MGKRRNPAIEEFDPRGKNKTFFEDTIVAVATPPGVGAIGIVKMSGFNAIQIASRICKTRSKREIPLLSNFHLTLCDVYDPTTLCPIDEALVVIMRGPGSYTCEDVVEIQVHGGPLLLQHILRFCIDLGARFAEPGEFTKRAFLNGRIDLSQAEAVAELVKASSERALTSAYRTLRGELGRKIHIWQDRLISIQASIQVDSDYLEGMITDLTQFLCENLSSIVNEMDLEYQKCHQFQLVRDGILVVICGKPNVGKSSILNSIVGRERAIVTPIPGTTRDVIEEHLIIDGYPLRFVDTAGIRESDDVIESLGIHKAREYLEMANIIVVIFDRSQNLQKEDFDLMEIVKNKTHIVVLNKSDLPAVLSSSHISELYSQEDIIEISALSGSGVSELLKKIVDLIRHNIHSEESMLAINTRQCEELVRSISSLHNALHSLQEGLTPDVVIFDIDDALRSLQRMNGENIDKKLLDTIFGSFCVGK